jgi:uncharacterized protein YndB with AHSA1/START domain
MTVSLGNNGASTRPPQERKKKEQRMPDILHRVGIKAPPDKVYKALTDEKGLAGWRTKNTKASPMRIHVVDV